MSPVSLVVLAIRLALSFQCDTHTHAHTLPALFLFCNVGSDRLMKRSSLFLQYFSLQRACCYLKYCRYRLSCLLFIRHFLFIVTHSHTRVRAAHTHTHTHARAHTHTHTHTLCMLDGLFSFFLFFFSIHVGHDHGLVKGERGVIATRTTFLLTAPLFFTFLTSNFPTLFVLLNFIL